MNGATAGKEPLDEKSADEAGAARYEVTHPSTLASSPVG
jgi:hypothetical protein